MTFKEEFNKLNYRIRVFASARQNPESEVVKLEETYNGIITDLQRMLPDILLNEWLDDRLDLDILAAMNMCKEQSYIEDTLEAMIHCFKIMGLVK